MGEKMLRMGDDIGKRMEVVGEEGTSIGDMIIYLKGELYDFSYLQQNAFDKEDAYCPLERQIVLFKLIGKVFTTDFAFDDHDSARSYFLELQNEIKNMNFMPFGSEHYHRAYAKIEQKIEKQAAALR
jgi:V/A-type H+-transporting ATPase subunit A